MSVAVQAESIAKSYPTRTGDLVVLRCVSLAFGSGESAAIMGPSGSGKSTLLNILGTLEPPTSGIVRIGDVDPYSLSPKELAQFRNRRIGFVFQEHHLLPQCSALENVLLPTLASSSSRGSGDTMRRARGLLDRVGLSGRLDHRPAELSGGERQRVAIARALIHEPALLLADEPTGNLDRASAESIAALLLEIFQEHQAALVVVTHSEKLAVQMEHRYELNEAALQPLAGAG